MNDYYNPVIISANDFYPVGWGVSFSTNMLLGAAMVATEPVAVASRGYNPSGTTQESLSGLGSVSLPTTMATGSFYSVAFEVRISSSLFPGFSRSTHFKAANEVLNSTMTTDKAFALSMRNLGVVVPRSKTGGVLGKSPINWVWHHDRVPGNMQLVPKYQHTVNSRWYYNSLHPGGFGGYSIWGK